jgi:hypothetical protein
MAGAGQQFLQRFVDDDGIGCRDDIEQRTVHVEEQTPLAGGRMGPLRDGRNPVILEQCRLLGRRVRSGCPACAAPGPVDGSATVIGSHEVRRTF